jgi:hypothetical protein
MKNLFFILSLSLFCFACKKEADTTNPEVKITDPIYGKTFKKGATINIKAAVQDANLDKVFLTVFEEPSKIYFKKEYDKSGQTSFALEESWVANTTSDSTEVIIVVSASDKETNVWARETHIFIKK